MRRLDDVGDVSLRVSLKEKEKDQTRIMGPAISTTLAGGRTSLQSRA